MIGTAVQMKGFIALHKAKYTISSRFLSYQSLPFPLHQCCFNLYLVEYVVTYTAKNDKTVYTNIEGGGREGFCPCVLSAMIVIKHLFNFHNNMSLRAQKRSRSGKP